MKKKLCLIFLVATFFMVGSAYADWAVTVTWTHSTGPNLAEEDCVMDGEIMKTVAASDSPTCQFNVTELKGQRIEIISRNTQGTSNGFVVGTLFSAPSPASNGSISTQWFNP